MSSTLRVTNVSDTTGGTSTNLMSGLAKAWWIWTPGGTAALDKTFNVSSLTDNGVGIFDFDFATSFSDTDYTPSGFLQGQSTGDSVVFCNRSTDTWTASTLTVICIRGDNNFEDSTKGAGTCNGDLA